jgi:putative phage-type endonuclease
MDFNTLIDDFTQLYNNDIKQYDPDWYRLVGTTIGGSEIASIIGINPYSSYYQVIESKIEICKGLKLWNTSESLSCWWGTLFENVITQYVEIDIGNKIRGTKICIQKLEGHRNSPDGYTVIKLYFDDGKYKLWTSDLSKDIIAFELIVLLEFKCPITRKITGNIPNYYKPQVLSGLSVSSIAHKGLFIDASFKKCNVDQLCNNPFYDITFHKKTNTVLYPLAWGVIPIYIPILKITDEVKDIHNKVFDYEYDKNNIIDMGNIDNDVFTSIMGLINIKKLISHTSTIQFADGRGDANVMDIKDKNYCYIFALLPWKIFDISYVPIDREPSFLENIYPIIEKIHTTVKYSLNNDVSVEKIKDINLCEYIYS